MAATALALHPRPDRGHAPRRPDPRPDPCADPRPDLRVVRDDERAPVVEVPMVPPAPVRAGLRLTARGRLALAAGLAGIVIASLALVGVGTGTAEPTAAVAGHVVIEPGQTLWDVAATRAPQGTDPRVFVGDLVELNGFTTADVPAWTVVLLPAG